MPESHGVGEKAGPSAVERPLIWCVAVGFPLWIVALIAFHALVPSLSVYATLLPPFTAHVSARLDVTLVFAAIGGVSGSIAAAALAILVALRLVASARAYRFRLSGPPGQ